MRSGRFRERRKKDGPPLPPGYRGWPKTAVIENPAAPNLCGIVIRDAYVTPIGARAADILGILAGMGAGFDLLFVSLDVGTLPFFIGAAAGVVAFSYVTKRFLYWLFARSFWIRIFADRVEIAGWSEFRVYETRVGYTFRLEEHEKAIEEDMQYRRNPEIGRYYSNTGRLFLDHGRQPVLVAAIYPKEKAKQLLGRLNDVQHSFDIGVFA